MNSRFSLEYNFKKTMAVLFWTCWIIEFIFACWWVFSEMSFKTLKPNFYAFLGMAYILLVLMMRVVGGITILSNFMVVVPAILLCLLGLLMLTAIVFKEKWN